MSETVTFSTIMSIVNTDRKKDFPAGLSQQGIAVEKRIKANLKAGNGPDTLTKLQLGQTNYGKVELKARIGQVSLKAIPDLVTSSVREKCVRHIDIKMRSGPREYDFLQGIIAIIASTGSLKFRGWQTEYYLYYAASNSLGFVEPNHVNEFTDYVETLALAALHILAGFQWTHKGREKGRWQNCPPKQNTLFELSEVPIRVTESDMVAWRREFDAAYETIVANANRILIAE